MSDITAATWKTWHNGETVELPATIDGIRQALPEQRRQVMLDEVHAAPAGELELLLCRWALETRPDIVAADEETVRRLQAGDFTGFTPAEELDQ